MRLLFLTLAKIDTVYQRGIYSDLIREIRARGHEIITVTPIERRFKKNSLIIKEGGSTIIKVWTPNIQKTNFVEKTLGLLLIQYLYKYALGKVNKNQNIDLIIYSTPPITFNWLIDYYKKLFYAKTYLLLKDIFPQNAVDLGLIKKNSLTYKYFLEVEKNLYSISNFIGTMSPANYSYFLKHNSEIDSANVEINPNSIEVVPREYCSQKKYDNLIPSNDKCVFVYGGNLGKPQKIEFLLNVLSQCREDEKSFFVVVGSGTEWDIVYKWFNDYMPNNAILLPELPQDQYEELLYRCDVGMIFLHPGFTIPNYPSRLLYYMLYKMPTLCATDSVTDVGLNAEKNKYGYWCEMGDVGEFVSLIKKLSNDKKLVKEYGKNAYKYLSENFSTKKSADILLSHFK